MSLVFGALLGAYEVTGRLGAGVVVFLQNFFDELRRRAPLPR